MIAAGLLAALVLALDPEQADDTARKVLAADKFAFCHDAEYPLTSVEAAWCPPVAPETNPRCPAFARACLAPRAELEHIDRLNFNRGAPGKQRPGDAAKPRQGRGETDGEPAAGPGEPATRKTPDRDRIEEPTRFEMPDLGGFAYVLFWLVLGLGLVLLVYVIIKNSARDRPEDEPQATPPEAAGAAPLREQASEQVVRDVDQLLDQARASAGAGDYATAVRLTHAALLHRLDHDGLIRVAPFRTNGDYVADLGPQPQLRAQVREIVRDVEQVQFGATKPDAGLFDRILKRVLPIATRRAETLALLLGVALVACTCTPPKSYPYDLSPSGTRAVVEVMQAHGRTLAYRARPLADIDLEQRDATLVLLHDAEVDPETWTLLLRWVDAGNHLVIAGLQPPDPYALAIAGGAAGPALGHGVDLFPPGRTAALVAPGGAYLVGDAGPHAVLLARADGEPYAHRYARPLSAGSVTIVADDRLFTNAAMMLGDNPELLVRLFAAAGVGPVELVDGMLDFGADSPAETIENSRLTAAILQLLALIALLYLWRGVHFGAPRDPPGRSRRSFTEHIEAVGQHYARARAARHAARLYAAWALDRLRERTLTARTPGLYALAQAIAGRTGDDEAKVMQLLVEASGARDDVDASAAPPTRAPSTADDLRLMQALARLVRLVGGPR